jgi:hypothetical protein
MGETTPMIYLLVALVGAGLALVLRRRFAALGLRRRFARGRRGEVDAEDFLVERGFRILQRQPTRRVPIWIDGRRQDYEVRADLLGARGLRTYVAEVTTGSKASVPATRSTRRQLLEYRQIYDADGLLLVDMTARRIRHVRFDARARGRGLALWLAAAVAGWAVGLATHDGVQAVLARLVARLS